MKEHSKEYTAYLRSARWKAKRAAVLKRAWECCERCGMPGDFVDLEVHHLTYKRLGDEPLADLQALCLDCHRKADEERAARSLDRPWKARLGGWATQKYGENWNDYHDINDVEEEFELWLERRDSR